MSASVAPTLNSQRLVYKTGRRSKTAYCYGKKPEKAPREQGRFGKFASGAAKATASASGKALKQTGKAIRKTSVIWPIKIFLGLLDIIAAPFGSMRGRDINFPLLWKAGAILLIVDVWVYLIIGRFGAKFLETQAFGPNLLIFWLAQIFIPAALGFGAVSLIIGGIRLQQGKSFSQKFGADLEPLPAFETGIVFKIGDLKLSLRDMHTNLGVYGGIGTGKAQGISASISTTYGSKYLKDVKIDDLVLSPTGGEVSVLDIIYVGEQTLWHVQTEDGLLTKCTSDHLWYVKQDGADGEILTQTGSLKELQEKGIQLLVQTEPSGFQWKKITAITKSEEKEECRCLVLSGTDHLYIADGIVTHNCLDPEQLVILWNGSLIKVKDLQSGDILMGPDGKGRRVLQTSTGFGPLYQIVPISGKAKPWICNDAHVMTLQYSNRNGSRPRRENPNGVTTKFYEDRQKSYKGISQVFGEIKNRTHAKELQQILEEHNYQMDVPLRNFIARKAPSRSLDLFWKLFHAPKVEFSDHKEHYPDRLEYTHNALNEEEFYLAGAWIGDGFIHSGWCNEDDAIKSAVKRYLTELADIKRDFRIETPNTDNPNFERIIPRGIGHGGAISNLEKYLLEFTTATLEHKSQGRNLANMYRHFGGQYDKDIPHWALVAPSPKRFQLLAGILDTDGAYDERGHCFDLTQKRLWIVEKTIWLCRSLGLAACEPYESWKEATNGTKTLPTHAELEADPGLLKDFAERGILKLNLLLKEGKIKEEEHYRLKESFEELLPTQSDIDFRKNYPDYVYNPEEMCPYNIYLTDLLRIHTLEKRERYWRTTISGDIHLIPTRVPHKQVNRERAETRADGRGLEHIESRDTKDELCFGWDAVPIGEGPYCGFTLDGDGRFLLGDFTVTHNTVALMIPLMRQFFQQLNHETNDPEDEAQKVAALILDEKGDFIDSTIMEMMLAGRSISDLVLIDPDLDLFRYNPLDPSQSADENAEKLGKVQKILGGGGGGGDNKYWDDTSKATIKYFLQLLEVYKPKEKIGLDDIARFMRDDQLATILCDEVEAKIESKKDANEINEETYGMIYDAISSTRNQWIQLSANTKSILKTTINQMLSSLASNPRLQKVFCRDTNFSFKDLPNKGKIVLFRGSGIDKATAKLICVCLKIDFQTWQKRRNGSAASAFGLNTIRTVLFICDEYQEFVTCGGEGDETFYGVSRSARTCAIVATQSMNSLKTSIKNQEQLSTLVQNITTWVFLRTTDKDTMELGALWAGQSKQEDYSQSQNTGGLMEVASNLSGGSGKDSSVNISRKLEENFRKDDFSKLITMTMEKSRTGPWYSEAIVYHYHDTDADAESRCYKTKIPHYYYSKDLRKQAGDNVSHLDNLLYDRNWQRKTLQRALVEIDRERKNAADTKKAFFEKMTLAGKGPVEPTTEEGRKARLLERATEGIHADTKTVDSKVQGKKLAGAISSPKNLSEEDIQTIKEKRQKLMADQANSASEEERKDIEHEIGRLNHMLAISQLTAMTRNNQKPGTVSKEILEANKNILQIDQPPAEEPAEPTATGEPPEEEMWDPSEGADLEALSTGIQRNILNPYDNSGEDEEDEEQKNQIRKLIQLSEETLDAAPIVGVDPKADGNPDEDNADPDENAGVPEETVIISNEDPEPPDVIYGEPEEPEEAPDGPDIPDDVPTIKKTEESEEDADGADDNRRFL